MRRAPPTFVRARAVSPRAGTARTVQTLVLASLGSLVMLVQWPPLARLVPVKPPHLGDWGLAAAGGAMAGLAAALTSLTLRRGPVSRRARAGRA